MIDMIEVFEAVTNKHGTGTKIFMAGGITNCPDWQSVLIKNFINNDSDDINISLYNPRRKNFSNDRNINTIREQIEWEFERLRDANIVLFWFSEGSLNPITLYELGMWGNSRKKPIIIGIDKKYERVNDVIIQTHLARPDIPVVDNLDDIAISAIKYVKQLNKGSVFLPKNEIDWKEWKAMSQSGKVCGILGCTETPTERCNHCSNWYCNEHVKMHFHIIK